jgi:aminopeptidase N
MEMRMKKLCLLVGLLLSIASVSSWSADSIPTLYLMELELLPADGQLVAAAEITLQREQYLDAELVFRLHETLAIERLEINGQAIEYSTEPVSDDPMRPNSKLIRAVLPEELRRPRLTLTVAWAGSLTPPARPDAADAGTSGLTLDDVIATHRIELAWYSAWYPQFGDFGTSFASDLVVSLPKGWIVASTGQRLTSETHEGHERSQWTSRRTNDLVVVAAPDFKRRSVTDGRAEIEIYSTRLPTPFIDREVANADKTLEIYRELFGEPTGDANTVRVVFSPRQAGQGGYTRPPMIVLSEGRVFAALRSDPRLSLLRGTAHEAAHFWWNFGRGQGDWINEAFAELFALVAVERIDSADRYRRTIAAYETAVRKLPDDAPPLAEVPPNNQGHGYTVRYHKGALMLHTLRQTMGDEAFFDACRAFYEDRARKPTGTQDFEEFWSSRLKGGAAELATWLHSPGGAPVNTGDATLPSATAGTGPPSNPR